MNHRDLIDGCVKGRKSAQTGLYNMYAPRLFAVCLRYTRNRPDAEDILQEGFVKIFKSIHTIDRDNEAVLYPWMRRVLINHALNYLRDHRKYRFVLSVDEIDDQIPDVSGDDRFEDLLGKAGQQKVQEAISALPDGYRTVFNLYAIEEYTHQEIADTLGCSVNTSKTQLMKARRALVAAIQSQIKKVEPEYKLVI